MWMLLLSGFGGDPHLTAVRVAVKTLIAEVAPQQAKLPQMVGNVLADIGNSIVGTDNHLGVFIWTLGSRSVLLFVRGWLFYGFRRRSSLHHPAAFVLALSFKIEHALLLELRKSRLPEMQMENFAFLRQEVVLNPKALHGLQMPMDDGVGNKLADFRGLVAAFFNIVQRLQTQLQIVFALFIPVRDAGIEVPAVVIERTRRRPAGGDERFNRILPFFFQIKKPDHHVRYLNAGIVNVVLYIYFCASRLQQAHKCIAQNGIAQVADMGRLVRVNAGMLNQYFLSAGRSFFCRTTFCRTAFCGTIEQKPGRFHPVEPRIDVSRSGDLKLFKACNLAQPCHYLLRDLARWLA